MFLPLPGVETATQIFMGKTVKKMMIDTYSVYPSINQSAGFYEGNDTETEEGTEDPKIWFQFRVYFQDIDGVIPETW